MAFPTETKTIAQLVLEKPRFAEILGGMRLNPTTEGNLTLQEVCALNSWDFRELLHQWETCDSRFLPPGDSELLGFDIPRLIGQILFVHHDYLEKEMGRLETLFQEAVQADGPVHSELLEMKTDFIRFHQDVLTHIQEEERILFPFFLMEASSLEDPVLSPQALKDLLKLMEEEDARMESDLSRLRDRSRNYHIPPNAGPSYHRVMEELKFLESELRSHAQVESRILFPKVAALEEGRLKRAAQGTAAD